MASSFRIYIDESGDEGFKFPAGGGGSSHWFVLSAAMIRTENDAAMVACMAASRKFFGRARNEPLHFRKLKHEQRIAWSHEIAKHPIRTASVLVHKPSVPDPRGFINDSYRLYRYASRLLIERCSWFCRDNFNGNGNGKGELIFSNRDRMSYGDLRDYWDLLRQGVSKTPVKVAWSKLEERFTTAPHGQLAGLQVADCVASAHASCVNKSPYGHCESGYFAALKPLLYRYNNRVIGYGLKFLPNVERFRPSNPHFEVFDGLK